jgi:hypothetical protein
MAFTDGLDVTSCYNIAFNSANYVAFGPSYKVFTPYSLDVTDCYNIAFNSANYVAFGPSYKVFTPYSLDVTSCYNIAFNSANYINNFYSTLKTFTVGFIIEFYANPGEAGSGGYFTGSQEIAISAVYPVSPVNLNLISDFVFINGILAMATNNNLFYGLFGIKLDRQLCDSNNVSIEIVEGSASLYL